MEDVRQVAVKSGYVAVFVRLNMETYLDKQHKTCQCNNNNSHPWKVTYLNILPEKTE